jgi:tetratricopeptide (TPR) repeat protein/transglutaminase-like putative cysteine protease
MIRRLISLSLCIAAPALAGEKPLYAPAPAWVLPAPPLDAAKLGNDAPVSIRLDTQQKLEDGQVWTYRDSIERAASTEVLGRIGTITIPWQPAHGDLIVHRVEIIRDGAIIDLIKGGTPFTVLRREQQLGQRILDGMLTATMPVEGLRVGDLVHITVSTTIADPTLKGRVQAIAPLFFEPTRIQYVRSRILWPTSSDVRIQFGDGVTRTPTQTGKYSDVTVTGLLPKAPEIPTDAPLRYRPLPFIETASFKDWADVAAVMAPLYATEGKIAPGSPLDAEVAKIAAASTDPMQRTAAALRLVQERLRYQLIALGAGNYVPQSPAESWTLRYGDCKAKTLLLLAILRKLGIEAEPVLANLSAGDIVAKRLPAAAAFDHVLVRATIGGETLWLDGTGSGARDEDLRDTPPLGWVLPLRASGATLLKVETHAPARPDYIVTIAYDQSAGIKLPARFTTSMTVRGAMAEYLRVARAQGSKDDIDQMVTGAINPLVPNATVVSTDLTFDEAAGTAKISATGVAYPDWTQDNDRLKISFDKVVSGESFSPDRTRPAWRDIPVSRGAPRTVLTQISLTLPEGGRGFTTEGNPLLNLDVVGSHLDRKAVLNGPLYSIEVRAANSGNEIPASAIPAERKRLADIQAQPLRVVAPEQYPAFWQEVENAKRTKATAPILAAFTQRITDKPDKADRYADRAWFNERIFERQAAIDDLTRAIAIEPGLNLYLRRAALYYAVGDTKKALADARAAHDLDPSSAQAISHLADLTAESGDRPAALAMIQERIDVGGDDKPRFLAVKAQIEADGGDRDSAMATLDAAVTRYPGNTTLLNARCWIKGLFATALDTALKDCTKAIELSESNIAALDSRAMAYFRLGRTEDALTDLEAVLKQTPDKPESLFMRAVIRKRTGDAAGAALDLKGARLLDPRVGELYARYGVVP